MRILLGATLTLPTGKGQFAASCRLSARSGPGLRYAYKASLIGSGQNDGAGDVMAHRRPHRSRDYADIAVVRLSYRPVSMQSRRFRADVEKAGGGRLAIFSTSWQTAALMAPQDQDYRAFIIGLQRPDGEGRKPGSISPAACIRGSMRPRSLWWRCSPSRWRGYCCARSYRAHGRGRFFWWALPRCLRGKWAASFAQPAADLYV